MWGLWLMRMAFTPMAFSSTMRRCHTSLGTAVPSTPASSCRQTPFTFIHWPFRAKPLLGEKSSVRSPAFTVEASSCSKLEDRVVVSV